MALPLAGRPVLHHVLSALAPAVDGVWVVTGHEASRVEGLVREWQGDAPSFVETVHNPIYAEGMLSSVLAGARAVPEGSYLFIQPGDYPLLTAAVFQSLRGAAMDAARTDQGGADAPGVFIPRHNGKNGHPVLLAPDCLAALRLLAEGEVTDSGVPSEDRNIHVAARDAPIQIATLKDFLAHWRTAYIDVDDEGVLIDLDTPEDYRRIEEKMRGREP